MAISQKADSLGKAGEEYTAKFLMERGYQILERNWRIKDGELDIIAISPDEELVFVEVKSRSSNAFGDPLESISVSKAMRIQRLALAWLATHQRLGSSFRIDAAGVLISSEGQISIDYRAGIL